MFLPQEMLDAILDWADEEDWETLQACTLVCHAWLFPSRRLLFRHVRVTGHYDSFFPRDCPIEEHPPTKRILAFLAFIRRPDSLAVRSCIRQLVLCGEPYNLSDADRKFPRVMPSMLVDLLSYLPSLENLELVRLYLGEHTAKQPFPTPVALGSPGYNMLNLSSLGLRSFTLQNGDIQNLVNLLAIFPSINSVFLDYSGIGSREVENEIVARLSVPPHIQIRDLTLVMVDNALLVRIVQDSVTSGTLESLTIVGCNLGEQIHVGALLGACGSNIRNLSLGIELGVFQSPLSVDPADPFVNLSAFCSSLALSKCTALESFIIRSKLRLRGNREFGIHILHAFILPQLPLTLRRLTIEIDLTVLHPHYLAQLDWHLVQTALKRFPDLEKVEFIVTNVDVNGKLLYEHKRAVKEGLNWLDERGILGLRDSSPPRITRGLQADDSSWFYLPANRL